MLRFRDIAAAKKRGKYVAAAKRGKKQRRQPMLLGDLASILGQARACRPLSQRGRALAISFSKCHVARRHCERRIGVNVRKSRPQQSLLQQQKGRPWLGSVVLWPSPESPSNRQNPTPGCAARAPAGAAVRLTRSTDRPPSETHSRPAGMMLMRCSWEDTHSIGAARGVRRQPTVADRR